LARVTRTVTLGLVQHACGDDAGENLARCVDGIREAAARGAGLVLTQELFRTRYFCQREDAAAFDLAEPVPGPTSEALAGLAAELGVVIVASLFERRAAGLYHNTAVVLDRDRGVVGRYRKMHVPDDPGYYEKYYFTPGDLGFRPVDTSVGRLGVLVCWDQWYPEAARLMALAGAEVLLYPTAIGWDPADPPGEQAHQADAWRTVQRAHAIANGLPVAACNRIGLEPDPGQPGHGQHFWGGSFVCGPQGEVLAEAPRDEPIVLLCPVDLDRTEQVRRAWPFLRDRRVDAYEGLTRRYLDVVP
jgi:N-carbamoylputrescine amidase